MPRVQRSDVTKLDGATKTPEGYIDTSGTLTCTGVFPYRRADGSVQYELRLPEHVFAPKAVESFHAQPLTLRHPVGNVNAASFKKDAVGFVLDPKKADDGIHLRARIRVMDAAAVQEVENGLKALSNGYTTELIPIPGGVFKRDDYNGGAEVRADFLQTEILGNHTALVDRGRAGPTARLDSAGNEETETMMTDEEKARFDAAVKLAQDEKQRADKLAGEKAALDAEAKQRADADAAKTKAELIARVSTIVKKDATELAKLDETAIMREALAVMQPSMKTDGWSNAMLQGAFQTALIAEANRTDSASAMARIVGGVREEAVKQDAKDENASETAYQKSRRDSANYWRQVAAK